MRVVVADASAIAEYVLRTTRGLELRSTFEDAENDFHVPALCDVEIVAVFRRAMLRRLLTPRRAAEALEDYSGLPLTRHGHLAILARVLALRENFSVYDATYVALAEGLQAGLLTADMALARAVATRVSIPVLPV